MRNVTFKMNTVEMREEKMNDFTKDFVGVKFEMNKFGFGQVDVKDLSIPERKAAHDFIMEFIESGECPSKDLFEVFCEAQAILEGKRKIGMLFRPKLAAIFPFDEEVLNQYSMYKARAVKLDMFANYDSFPSIII